MRNWSCRKWNRKRGWRPVWKRILNRFVAIVAIDVWLPGRVLVGPPANSVSATVLVPVTIDAVLLLISRVVFVLSVADTVAAEVLVFFRLSPCQGSA